MTTSTDTPPAATVGPTRVVKDCLAAWNITDADRPLSL